MVAQRLLHNEQGVTLVEVLLVSIFGVIILGVAFQMVFLVQGNLEVNARRALTANEVGVPLDILDRYLAQNIEVTSFTDYTCTLTIPIANSDDTYTISFAANTNGTITMQRIRKNASGVSVTNNLIISSDNANRAAGIPLFNWVQDDLTTVATSSETMYAVESTVVAKTPRMQLADTVESTRLIMFRNR